MEVLQYNGYEYAFSRYGDLDAPAVVLIMGLGMSSAMWPASLISSLVAEGFQVITPDNRDSGRSSRITEFRIERRDVAEAVFRTLNRMRVTSGYALEDMAFDTERLLSHLRIRRAHVVGISMGGMIAQVLATQCPNRVASLVSISSATGNPRTGFGHLNAVWSILHKPSDIETHEGQRRYFSKVLRVLSGSRYRLSEAELEGMLRYLDDLNYDGEAVYRQVLAILASGDRTAQLARLKAPTLVIHGKEDPLLPFSAGEETARVIPNARLVAIDGLGHQMPAELMPEYGRLIAAHCHRNPA